MLLFVHVALSLVGLTTGFCVIWGMLNARPLDRWTMVFLATTLLTSLTGFLFPIHGFTPGIGLGLVSLPVLGLAIYARYGRQLAGPWCKVYVITVVVAQYLNFFVLIVQSFMKIPDVARSGTDAVRAAICHCPSGGTCGIRRVGYFRHGRRWYQRRPYE